MFSFIGNEISTKKENNEMDLICIKTFMLLLRRKDERKRRNKERDKSKEKWI
jgi:hypothetical protein